MAEEIGALRAALSASSAAFEKDMKAARDAVRRSANDMQSAMNGVAESFNRTLKNAFSLRNIIPQLFAGASVAGLVYFVKSTIDAADRLNDLSKSTGVSVETLSTMGYAAKQSGVDMESLGIGFKKLGKNMADAASGTGEAKDAFKVLGISVKDNNGNLKTSEQVMLELADKFAGIEDGAGKTALQTPDRGDFAAQRDLAGHRDVGAHRNTRQRRDERGRHRDTRARPVLGRRTVGDVDVDVALLEQLVVDPEPARAAAHHRARGLDRLLHHVAQLTRADDVALAGHHRGLDRQQVAADHGPRQTDDLADLVLLLGAAEVELAHTEEVVEVVLVDDDLRGRGLELQALDRLAADLRDLALERAHAGLAGDRKSTRLNSSHHSISYAVFCLK